MLFSTKNIIDCTDEELIKKGSSRKVWGELYKRYAVLVFGVCLKYLKDTTKAEDATSELFVKLPQLLNKSEINNFKARLHTVSRNHCFMMLRKINKEDVYEEQLHGESLIEEDSTELELNREILLNGLSDCMCKLKPEQQTCIRLFYIENKSYQEVVDETNFELKKVKSYLQNGKRNLKICLENK